MPYDLSPVSGSHDPKYKRDKQEWDTTMNPKAFKRILKTIKDNPANKLNRDRDYIMFVIMGNMGMRVGELIILKKKHFKLIEDKVPPPVRVPVLKKRKKNQFKQIYVHSRVLKAVNKYMDWLKLGDDNYLFESESAKDGHITDRTVRNTFYHYVRAIGLKENLSPHSLRHMFGSLCYEYTKDAKWVQLQLAHSAMGGGVGSVTSRYIHVSEKDKIKYIEQVGYIL